MSRLWRPAIAAVLMAAAIVPGPIGSAQRAVSAPPYPLSDGFRSALVLALDPHSGAERERPSLDFSAIAASLEREFQRSPSLFTLLDYGLILEAIKNERDRKNRKVPPDVWSDASFTRLRQQLERYVVARPVPTDDLPRRSWWVDATERPAIFVNSRRKPVMLEPATPSLFRSDVDVYAFGGVPFVTRERMRLGSPKLSGPFVYSSQFEPQMDFPTLAPLLGALAPFVEMIKVQGGNRSAEVIFDKPRLIQEVIDDWSAIVDTGSGSFIGHAGYWPVFAITGRGIIEGTMLKVVSHGTHCSSSDGLDFFAQFSFPRPLPTATYAIVQTGLPFDIAKARITTARELTFFARPTYDHGLWYADLNADGHQDIAVAIGGVAKNYGDVFVAYVYANVNGRWKVLFVPEISGCT